MTGDSDEVRKTLNLIRQTDPDLCMSADGRWVVNTRTGEQTYDGVPLERNYWEERELWVRDFDKSGRSGDELQRIYVRGRPAAFIGRNEGAFEALDRMWARLCANAPSVELPCGCIRWQTRVGGHLGRSACTLNGYQHEDCLRWLGII